MTNITKRDAVSVTIPRLTLFIIDKWADSVQMTRSQAISSILWAWIRERVTRPELRQIERKLEKGGEIFPRFRIKTKR